VEYQRFVFDGQGGCTASKCGVSATRVPQKPDSYKVDPVNYTGDFEYK
jgi:hypothetical protein